MPPMDSTIERILANPAIGARAWRELVQKSWDAPPPPGGLLQQIEAAITSWPDSVRSIEAAAWERVRGRAEAPFWWPWVRTLAVGPRSTLAPSRWLSGITCLLAEGEDDGDDRRRGYHIENQLIEDLVSLREFSLRGHPNAFELDPSCLPARIADLDLTGAEIWESLGGFEGRSSIERLHLAHTTLESLDGIQGMASLRELDLSGCGDVRSLDALRSLDLRRLRFGQYLRPPLEPLGHLRALEELEMPGSFSVIDLSTFVHLATLRRLELGGQGIRSLAPMSRASRSLTSLHLTGVECLDALDGMEGLSSLERLVVEGAPRLVTLRPLAHLQGLRTLELENLGAWRDLESVAVCRGLRVLTLNDRIGQEGPRSVDFLPGLTELEELHLDLHALEVLPPLDTLSRLRSIRLRCPRLRSVSALRGLPRLEAVTLDDCEGLHDLAPLDALPSLKEIRLHGRSPRAKPSPGA